MAGFWEFPGGKFEAGESAQQALYRELEEELGVQVPDSEPLITLTHHYPERSVRLHVRLVREWLGEPQSLDQQALRWVSRQELPSANLLPADVPIVNAILLPGTYAISPVCDEDMPLAVLDAYLARWQQQAVELVQWRQPAFTSADSEPSAASIAQALRVAAWAASLGVTAVLNCAPSTLAVPSWASRLGFDGIHVKASYLNRGSVGESLKAGASSEGLKWVSAACHSVDELQRAAQQGCDFAVLGPVRATATHPGLLGMGWDNFALEASEAALPVYALGGCSRADIGLARQSGAQGVAGISEFWSA